MKNWLNNAVVYEIYPQSFYDTNNDGIGDLRGIIEKLDYIKDLGFTAIWLNPINPSSFRDAGYDVTDFYDVDKRYGTLDDYKELCEAAHKKDMRVIFDLVAGHTSIDHPDCIATKNELIKIIDFWADLGTDAFRVDMAASLIKGDTDGSAMKAFWNEIRAHMEKRNPDCLLISEWGLPATAINSGFHLDFLLHSACGAYTSLFRHEEGRNTTKLFVGNSYFNSNGKGDINEYLDRLLYDLKEVKGKGYIGMITGNHDMQRLAYKRTPDELKVALAFLFTMPGVPFVYYGDEIGMDYIEGLPSKEGGYIRTGSRTPMQWNSSKNHGFSDSNTPYLPTDSRENAPTVESQLADKNSVLNFTKQIIKLHKENTALWAEAEFNALECGYPFVFERYDENGKIIVYINPSDREFVRDIPENTTELLSLNCSATDGKIRLSGVSCYVAKIN